MAIRKLIMVFSFLSAANLAIVPASAQEKSRISISPVVTYSRFGGDLSFNPAFGYGLSIAYRPDSEFTLRLIGNVTSTQEEFAVIGGNAHLNVTAGVLRVQTEYRLFQGGSSFVVLASASLGMLMLNAEEYTVSLGALGQQVIAPHSEVMPLYGISLILDQAIMGNVSLKLEPAASLYSHGGSSHSLLSISGGISVGIL